jgi:hypothetical protein
VSVDVQAKVHVYEDDASDTWGDSELQVIVESHWNDPDAIVVEIEGKRYTVIAHHLTDAIRAATVRSRR